MTVANPDDDDLPAQDRTEHRVALPDVEVLEEVDLDQAQELGPGLAVDAAVRAPRPRRKRATDVPPPRRWPRVGHMELRSCPVCHATVANIKEAFWHLQASHGGETPDDIDMDEWGEDLQQEVQEYRDAIRSGKARVWRSVSPDQGLQGSHMAAVLLAIIVLMLVTGIIYILASIGR